MPAHMNRFGIFFKEKRLELELSLRSFCQKNSLDPGNLSKLERGLIPPPTSREKLERYAEMLHLTEGSNDWYEFFDLAAAEAGRIPDDVMSDSRVIDKLPVVFRTLRGQQVEPEALEELINLIKES